MYSDILQNAKSSHRPIDNSDVDAVPCEFDDTMSHLMSVYGYIHTLFTFPSHPSWTEPIVTPYISSSGTACEQYIKE